MSIQYAAASCLKKQEAQPLSLVASPEYLSINWLTNEFGILLNSSFLPIIVVKKLVLREFSAFFEISI